MPNRLWARPASIFRRRLSPMRSRNASSQTLTPMSCSGCEGVTTAALSSLACEIRVPDLAFVSVRTGGASFRIWLTVRSWCCSPVAATAVVQPRRRSVPIREPDHVDGTYQCPSEGLRA